MCEVNFSRMLVVTFESHIVLPTLTHFQISAGEENMSNRAKTYSEEISDGYHHDFTWQHNTGDRAGRPL